MPHKEIKYFNKLIFNSVLLSLADVISLASIVPILMFAIDGDFLEKSKKLRYIHKLTGINSEKYFLFFLIFIVIIFFIFKSIFAFWLQKKIQKFSSLLVELFSNKAFENAIHQNFNKIQQKGSSSELFHMSHFGSFYFVFSAVYPFLSVVAELTILIITVLLLLIYNPIIVFLIGLAVVPSFYFLNKSIKIKVNNLGKDIAKERESLIDALNININGLMDIKLNNSHSFFVKQISSIQRKLVNKEFKVLFYQQIPIRTNEIIVLIGVIILVLYGYFSAQNPNFNSGGMRILAAMFVIAIFRLIPALNRILISFIKINQNKHLTEYLKNNKKIYGINDVEIEFINSIEIKNLTFEYFENHNLLSNIDLNIKKGTITTITGNSGQGKSTLIKLMSGLFGFENLNIHVDGNKLNNKMLKSWQSQISFVHQNPFIYNTTLKNNIIFDLEFNNEKFQNVIMLSGLNEMLESLPEKENTNIGEMGSKLSEGQKQRLAIARAIYRDTSIIFFDEATSNLDETTENHILKTIYSLKKLQKTIIIIAHKKSMIDNLENVFELKHGKLDYVRE